MRHALVLVVHSIYVLLLFVCYFWICCPGARSRSIQRFCVGQKCHSARERKRRSSPRALYISVGYMLIHLVTVVSCVLSLQYCPQCLYVSCFITSYLFCNVFYFFCNVFVSCFITSFSSDPVRQDVVLEHWKTLLQMNDEKVCIFLYFHNFHSKLQVLDH